MPPVKPALADDFSQGSVNTPEFVDLPYMKQEHVVALRNFIVQVAKGQPLVGKNKPSWLGDNLQDLPHTQSYKANNYWHYHCGPSYSNASVKSMTYNLNMNLEGLTSPEVIHYEKKEDGSIVIVGFSPNHIPFPPSDLPGHSNPLFSYEETDD